MMAAMITDNAIFQHPQEWPQQSGSRRRACESTNATVRCTRCASKPAMRSAFRGTIQELSQNARRARMRLYRSGRTYSVEVPSCHSQAERDRGFGHRCAVALAFGLGAPLGFAADAYKIKLYAGTGDSGYSGDGGPATKAQLGIHTVDEWTDLCLDSHGNLYFTASARIRKVDTSGIITTVAGNGKEGWYSGEGGPATEANLGFTEIGSPTGVTGVYVDAADTLFSREVVGRPLLESRCGRASSPRSREKGQSPIFLWAICRPRERGGCAATKPAPSIMFSTTG